MPRWAERQRNFGMALLDPVLPVPAGLVGPDGAPSQARFAVYRNNVVAGLTETLKEAFPAVHRIVGQDFFRAMARIYVAANPPTSPILLHYGAGFPDFIAGFPPAMSLPYLRDVAQIERAWIEAYHAPEEAALGPAALRVIEPELLPGIQLRLHPSLRVVQSDRPALTIWSMNVEGGVAAPVDLACGEDVLVLRPAAEVEVRAMPPGAAAFITALAAGQSVMDAIRSAADDDSRFDLSANLAELLGAGAFVGFGFTDNEKGGLPGRWS